MAQANGREIAVRRNAHQTAERAREMERAHGRTAGQLVKAERAAELGFHEVDRAMDAALLLGRR